MGRPRLSVLFSVNSAANRALTSGDSLGGGDGRLDKACAIMRISAQIMRIINPSSHVFVEGRT